MTEDIYVVGNGKSLKDFDFEFLRDKTWIGMCLAYRHWEKINLYPTHYVCIDSVVLKHNLEDIKKLILENKCETFFLNATIINEWKEILNFKNVFYIQQFKRILEHPFRYLVDYCSGTSGVLYGYCLSPKKIHILGCDCDYVEFIPECKEIEKDNQKILQITKTPESNPNYYFDDYQREGDLYNIPRKDDVHKRSWFDLRNTMMLFNILTGHAVEVYDYSPNKEQDFFEKKSLSIL
jgi:hypothetical protein